MPHDTDKHLEEWYPSIRPPTAAGTFEIGLVLAGAVSAGAYTAGVLDFLYEALDYWDGRSWKINRLNASAKTERSRITP
jgi:hypothetical protein